MRITGHQESPHGAEDREVFEGLHLSGTPGRVRVSITERKLSIEHKSGHCVEIDNQWVMKMEHTRKPLLPFGYLMFGGLVLWLGARGMVLGSTSQFLTIGFGFMLMLSHTAFRRPIATIETQSHEWYMLSGNDARLMRLCELHRRLNKGQTMEQARLGLDELQRDIDYPRSNASELAPIEPVRLEAPLSISTLLAAHADPDQIPKSASPLDLYGEIEPLDLDFGEPASEPWMFGEEETIAPVHGLIARGQAHARTRRNMGASTTLDQQPSLVHHPAHPYPVTQHHQPVRSFERIAEHAPHIARTEHVESSFDAHGDFLPSFYGPDGAHVPHAAPHEQEPEFDDEMNLFGEAPSIISAARVDEEVLLPAPAQTVASNQNTHQYTIKQRPSVFSDGRYKVKMLGSQGNSRMRGIFNRISEGVTLTGKLMSGAEPSSSEESQSGRELRQRSSANHQDEVKSSVENLSQMHGGVLPDEEVARLRQHIDRRSSVAEQIEQEVAEQQAPRDLEEFSFEDLTETVIVGEDADASGISRIDF
jgi:hypothetical protein